MRFFLLYARMFSVQNIVIVFVVCNFMLWFCSSYCTYVIELIYSAEAIYLQSFTFLKIKISLIKNISMDMISYSISHLVKISVSQP